ncbi:hypothetical protein SERLA73DRAFT_191032 [Serpula lacrymans var. lacrymans S7.3]|uniref:Acid phosphatase n=2 Tax=Serpula lacrymans var. lacrymans TaxID=341189 RepID=F8QGU1_SERL3|nr:uncharacterized protein SERLADRAFT_457150 [Serpula lacrymans var. lacrymans S7.9]EGN92524.1 hypothetical protein SERLA73DRAFT_191032 [Serpula lacrymans var. lacrymans S7.3]EGO29429.1 hypothetical protein SERLADRAFT_457150 [Serpula lacrymans var. lacrymans S7.9]
MTILLATYFQEFQLRYGTLRILLLLFMLTSFVPLYSNSAQQSSNFFVEGMAIGLGTNNANNTATIHPPYTLKPPQTPLDVDDYPVAPEELELAQVHVYVRHGERTPVGVRMSEPPGSIPENWIMCRDANEFGSAMAANLTSIQSGLDVPKNARRAVERRDGTSTLGLCLLGQLTDLGRQSTFDYGAALRKLYVERLHFLPDTLEREEEVYFRSTNVPRTIESLQQIKHGLYPELKYAAHAAPSILIRNGLDDNLIGNTYACKRLQILQLGFARAAAAAINPTLEPLNGKLSKYINGNPVLLDGQPKASGILDTIRAATAHGVPVPPEFMEDDVMDLLEKSVATEWFEDKTEEVRRLGMGPLLSDLMKKIQRKVDPESHDMMKILVHSTHDSTLAALLATLDAYDGRWPPFTSSVTFELFKLREARSRGTMFQNVFSGLWKSTPNINDYYIRARYKNKNLMLPLCADEGKHLSGFPEFCTLSAFQKRVEELTPRDWESECSHRGNKTTNR